MSAQDLRDDVVSEVGDPDPFRAGASSAGGARQTGTGYAANPAFGMSRTVPSANVGWGRGPASVDKRRFRYDVNAAMTRKAIPFGATKVDRMDASQAGDYLHRIHKIFGIDNEIEERIYAFDQALWYEHAVNGGSTLQAERGTLQVDKMEFDIPSIVKVLGVDARRFFRAYADDIAQCIRGVLEGFDPFDPESAEKYGAVMQVAVARGLQKYPYLIHDSSDAGLSLSIEERVALQASKSLVIKSTVNAADAVAPRVGQSAGADMAAAVKSAG